MQSPLPLSPHRFASVPGTVPVLTDTHACVCTALRSSYSITTVHKAWSNTGRAHSRAQIYTARQSHLSTLAIRNLSARHVKVIVFLLQYKPVISHPLSYSSSQPHTCSVGFHLTCPPYIGNVQCLKSTQIHAISSE